MANAIRFASFSVRSAIYVSAWVIGHTVDALTSRRAIRIYAAIWGALVYACQSAIESGRIVGAGYYSVDQEPEQLALPASRVIAYLPPAAEPVAEIHILPLPVLVTPAPVVATIALLAPAKEVVAKPHRSAPDSSQVHGAIDFSQLLSSTGKPLTGAAFTARMRKLATV